MGYQSRNLPISTFLLVLLNIFVPLHAQFEQYYCANNGNYTINSTYQSNLNTLFSTLSSGVDDNGFYNTSVGQGPNRVYGMVLCRGDVQLELCRNCTQIASVQVVQQCPNQMEAIVWREYCTLRFSNESMYGIMDDNIDRPLLSTQNATSPDVFMSDLRNLLDNLRGEAAGGGFLRKVAFGSNRTVDFLTLYGIVQCTPDLVQQDCDTCVYTAARRLPSCCNWAIGARVLLPSCNIRYETVPFYNETRLRELEFVPAPPATSPLSPSPPPGNDVNTTPSNSNNSFTRTIIIIVVSVVAVIITLAVFVVLLCRRRTKKMHPQDMERLDNDSMAESLQYDLTKIRMATNDFSEVNKLGQGGFGAVYKGLLPNGQQIAVKRLSRNSGQGDLEFKNEVMLLARLQHRNLVRLLGFSMEGTERILVYEFVQNSSLDYILFDRTKRPCLNWDTRYKIIGGIAKGMLYLHEDSRLRIIHRDLKAGNILLDGEMNPKIADFGMARLFVQEETQGNTSRIVGTYGYMSPEYALHGQFSVKSDVYSFGILILEIISGQKNSCFQLGDGVADLVNSAWESWRKGSATNFVDPLLKDGEGIPRDVLRCIHIGLLCVQENAAERPTMASVVLMLNSYSITLAIPSKPAYAVPKYYEQEDSENTRRSDSVASIKSDKTKSSYSSQNSLSITEFHAR